MDAETCSWWPADSDTPDEGIFETECGRTFEFTCGCGISDNGFVFCPFCGGRIEESSSG